jgi:hypothetical protein
VVNYGIIDHDTRSEELDDVRRARRAREAGVCPR